MKPRVSDACAALSPRCEDCEFFERGYIYPPDGPMSWFRRCEAGYVCTAGMICRDFKPSDPHAFGRLF